jgi:hypothetical protein
VRGVVTCAPPSASSLRCSFFPTATPSRLVWTFCAIPFGWGYLAKQDAELAVAGQTARRLHLHDRAANDAALRQNQMIGRAKGSVMSASTTAPFFDVEELSGVTKRACTTLPVGGGAPMQVSSSGWTDSVPKSSGCCKLALKLVPKSMYCG